VENWGRKEIECLDGLMLWSRVVGNVIINLGVLRDLA